MEPCLHCGDAGVLNILSTSEDGVWTDFPQALACHACPMGLLMIEIGVPV